MVKLELHAALQVSWFHAVVVLAIAKRRLGWQLTD